MFKFLFLVALAWIGLITLHDGDIPTALIAIGSFTAVYVIGMAYLFRN